jgi:hypothetical protein
MMGDIPNFYIGPEKKEKEKKKFFDQHTKLGGRKKKNLPPFELIPPYYPK